jgi:hypothetical protein
MIDHSAGAGQNTKQGLSRSRMEADRYLVLKALFGGYHSSKCAAFSGAAAKRISPLEHEREMSCPSTAKNETAGISF